jgi:hypothetical protein
LRPPVREFLTHGLIFAVVAVALAFLVLLMKRSVAGKGAHLAAE